MRKIIHKLADILLCFYDEIIAGVWAVLVIIPIDSALYKFFTGTPSYNITSVYWIAVGCYTTFFLISGGLIPVIKKKRFLKTLNFLQRTKQINLTQKKQILFVINDLVSYKSLLSKDGALNFLMTNLFEFGVMFSWFGIEGMISNIIDKDSLIVPAIFMALFLAFLTLQSFIDEYIAQGMEKKTKVKGYNQLCYASKTLMMQLIEDLGAGGSNDKIGEILLKQTIEDISDVISIANKDKKNAFRSRK